MTTTGGSGAHEWQVSGTLEAWYFWVCRCGAGGDLPHRSEQAAAAEAAGHVAAPPR